MVNHVSNDEPIVDGETDEQKWEHEGRNADCAQRRDVEAEEVERLRGPRPRDLNDAFDRVSDR